MTRLLTIAIPTFNRASLLAEALLSVRAQGLDTTEYVVLIADNCSTDDTAEVIRRFSDIPIEHERHKTNIGANANFKFAAARCSTPWLTILPDDDIIVPGRLRANLDALRALPGAALIASPVAMAHDFGSSSIIVNGLFPRGLRLSEDGLHHWEDDEWLSIAAVETPFSIIGATFKADCIADNDALDSLSILADQIWLAEAIGLGRVYTFPWIGGYYRLHGEQTNRMNFARFEAESTACLARLAAFARSRGVNMVDAWVANVNLCPHASRQALLAVFRKLPSDLRYEIERRLVADGIIRLSRGSSVRRRGGRVLRAVVRASEHVTTRARQWASGEHSWHFLR